MSGYYLSTRSRVCDIVLLYDIAHGKAQAELDYGIAFLGDVVLSDVCKWPEEQERAVTAHLYEQRYSLPLCVGAVDGTLIRIMGFGPNKADLTGRKSHYGFNLLLFCDDRTLIRYYVNGAPASFADSSILDTSVFMQDIASRLSNSVKPRDNYYVLSDKGIVNTDFIVTAYIDNGSLTRQQLRFNYLVQKGRAIIERANGFLKLRLQAIRETMTAVKPQKAKAIICACIALHNWEILNGDLVA